MARSKKNLPTDAELRILGVLWSRGPSTVREVHGALSEIRRTGPTTVLKLMQIMTQKGWIRADKSVRPQLFRPAQTEGEMQRQLVRDLLERAFGGSPGRLVLQALSERKASPEERARIREMLDQIEREADE